MFTTYSWVEINIFMYAMRTSNDGAISVSLQKIADEFGITRGIARHAVDKLVEDGFLKKTSFAQSSHKVRTKFAQSSHSDVANTQQVKEALRTKFAQSSHKVRTKFAQDVDQRKHSFGELLIPYISQYGKQEIRRFFDYWTEMNPNGQKMRFEKEKTFEVSKRLARWNMNQNYDKGKDYEQRQQDERQQRLNEYASVAAAFARQAEEDLRSRSAENQEGIS